MKRPPPAPALLRDDDGVPVLAYLADSDGEHSVAHKTTLLAPIERTVPYVLRDLAGWTVVGPPGLADALQARGARVRRRFRTMTRSLLEDPPPASWQEADLGPGRRPIDCSRPAAAVFPTWYAAYSVVGHPDHPDPIRAEDERLARARGTAPDADLMPVLSGRFGAVLPWSALAVDADDRVVAGVIALAPDSHGPREVPWLGDVFRHPAPAYAGLGGALLRRVLAGAAAAGVGEVGLSVSDANPAARVYERLGFTTTAHRATVIVTAAR